MSSSVSGIRFRLLDGRYITLELETNQTVADVLGFLCKERILVEVDPDIPLALYVPPRDSTMGGWWLKPTDTLKYLLSTFAGSSTPSSATFTGSTASSSSSSSASSTTGASSLHASVVVEVKYTPKALYFGIGELSDMWVRAFEPSSGGRGSWEELLVDYTDPIVEVIPVLTRVLKVRKGEEYFFRHLECAPVKKTNSLNVNLSFDEQDVTSKSPYILLAPVASLCRIQAEHLKNPVVGGFLTKVSVKEGKTTAPKKRWCVIYENFLFYFKTQSGPPAGVVPLEYYSLNLDKSKIQFELAYTGLGFCRFRPNFIFNSDNIMELEKWSTAIRARCFGSAGKSVFGVPLEKLLRRSRLREDSIPSIARDTVNALYPFIEEEGIFRKSGSALLISQFKNEYDCGNNPDLSTITDPHAISGLLKLWLRELPEPLLTFELCQPCLDVVALPSEQAQIEAVKKIVQRLPRSNYSLLSFLIPFLHTVSLSESKNLMHAANLATVFGPNILSPQDSSLQNMMHLTGSVNKFVEFLIRNSPQIFGNSVTVDPGSWGTAPFIPTSTSGAGADGKSSSTQWGLSASAKGSSTGRVALLGLGSTRGSVPATSPEGSPEETSASALPQSTPPIGQRPHSIGRRGGEQPPVLPSEPPPSAPPARPARPGSSNSTTSPLSSQPSSSSLSSQSLQEQVRILTAKLEQETEARLRLEEQVKAILDHLGLSF